MMRNRDPPPQQWWERMLSAGALLLKLNLQMTAGPASIVSRVSLESLSQNFPAKPFLIHKICEIINVYCSKSLSLGLFVIQS